MTSALIAIFTLLANQNADKDIIKKESTQKETAHLVGFI